MPAVMSENLVAFLHECNEVCVVRVTTRTTTKVSKNSTFGEVFKDSTFNTVLNWQDSSRIRGKMMKQGIPCTTTMKNGVEYLASWYFAGLGAS